jgi:hypothetical protein
VRKLTPFVLEIHTKHINVLCGQNFEFLHSKTGGRFLIHWAVNGSVATLLTKCNIVYLSNAVKVVPTEDYYSVAIVSLSTTKHQGTSRKIHPSISRPLEISNFRVKKNLYAVINQ